jgi:dTDP-4-dehydrorhamnose reductase
MKNFDHILIFRTNIKSASDKIKLQPILDAHKSIQHWNVDLDDVDNVLRVVSYQLKPRQVIELIAHHGYECCELE